MRWETGPIGLASRRGSIGCVLLLGFVAGVVLGCGTAIAGGPEPHVRVLVHDSAEPVRVGRSGGRLHRVSLGEGQRIRVEGIGSMVRWEPGGAGPWRVGERLLRGRIRVQRESGRIRVLNRVGLEDYVVSAVGGEMMSSWPREALRAQAVAARTYVLHEAEKRRGEPWDVRATALSQVYRGIEAETKETRRATRSTRGQILTWGGAPILAVFHSTAGGRTASAGEVWGEDRPYLRVVEVDDEDDAPHTYWRTAFEPAELERVLATAGLRVGRIRGLAISERTASGRVRRLVVEGSEGRASVSGPRLREILGGLALRSTLFEVRRSGERFVFVGSGHGHGVGMSQWGARAMARRGASYEKILATFYPGTRLERYRSRRIARSVPLRLAALGVGP